jgi:hypothetical protein
MMPRSLCSLALVMAAAFTAAPAGAEVDVPAVSGPPYTIEPGEVRKFERIRNGEEMIATARLIDDTTMEISRTTGCVTTFSTEDRYGPNLTWAGCHEGAWGTGHITDLEREGKLWPFEIGNKVSYRFKAHNSKGKTNRNAFRECEAAGKEVVQAGGRDYPTYRVECVEHSGTRTYWYAPEVEATVRYERNHKKRGRTTSELVERLQ